MNPLDAYPLVLAAICLWREARNQTYSAMLGVAWVLKNRITPTKDLVAVIAQRMQFSGMTAPGDPNLVKWAFTGDAAFSACCTAVEMVFGGTGMVDPTRGAQFYFSPPITEPPVDEWGPVNITVVIDQLTFCKSQ